MEWWVVQAKQKNHVAHQLNSLHGTLLNVVSIILTKMVKLQYILKNENPIQTT